MYTRSLFNSDYLKPLKPLPNVPQTVGMDGPVVRAGLGIWICSLRSSQKLHHRTGRTKCKCRTWAKMTKWSAGRFAKKSACVLGVVLPQPFHEQDQKYCEHMLSILLISFFCYFMLENKRKLKKKMFLGFCNWHSTQWCIEERESNVEAVPIIHIVLSILSDE